MNNETKTTETARRLQVTHNNFESSDYGRFRPIAQGFANVDTDTEGENADDESLISLNPENFYG